MKNKALLVVFSLFLAGGAMAQNSRIGQHESISTWSTPKSSFASASEGQQVAQEIINAIGLKPNFEVKPANIPNAAAVVYGGKRYILYNPNFISQLTRQTGSKWAAISVLAHEIGHHLNGHTLTGSGSQPAVELEADEFSGFVLRKMGASLSEAQAAMKLLASAKASRTHPGQADRLASIARGWNNAGGQEGSSNVARTTPAKPSVTQRPQSNPTVSAPQRTAGRPASRTSGTAIAEQYIIGDVRFNADPSSRYYVTTRFNLVKVDNNGLSVIGKLATLNSRQFPYMIYDEANTQLLVDQRGNIVTRNGQKVGMLSSRG